MFDAQVIDPMDQFKVRPIVELYLGSINVSLTNSALWMIIALVLLSLFFYAATRRTALIPGRLQSMAEVFYEFTFNLVNETIGSEGRKFFPYVFTLFSFILAMNLFGLLPSWPGLPHELHTLTPTSHIIVTAALAFLTITIVIVYGFWKNGLKFLKLFWPSGLPWPMYIIIPIIELISFLSRPLSLAIRLFANMFAGHLILKLFAGFVIMLLAQQGAVKLFGVAPFLGAIAVTGLEFLVAALQAYVFAVLTCIYLSDAAHAADH